MTGTHISWRLVVALWVPTVLLLLAGALRLDLRDSPAFGFAAAGFLLWTLVLPLGPALAGMAGLLVGYLCYDLGHYAWHHAACRRGLARFLKRCHLAHHFRDQHSRYGVSQPLWDVIFRSGSLRL